MKNEVSPISHPLNGRLFFRLSFLLIISIIILSCSKTDDEKNSQTASGSMTYLNKTYKFTEAKIISQNVQNGVYRYSVAIYADDVKWNSNGTFSDGHYLSLALYCSSANGIAPGTYTGNLSDAYIAMTANSSTFFDIKSVYPYTSYTSIHPDNIIIKLNGSIYEISYSGADAVDREFSATFKGSIKKL